MYLDEDVMAQYLSQLEGGVYEEEEQSESGQRERGVGANLKGGPVGAEAKRGTSSTETRSRTMRQTPEASYARLEALLKPDDQPQWFEAFDTTLWQSLQRGELIAVESVVEVPSVYEAAELASGVGPLMDLMRLAGEEVDDEAEVAIAGMAQFASLLKELPVLARAAGSPKYKFICPLKRTGLRVELSALNGDCVVVGSVARHIRPGKPYSLLDSVGLGSGMSREDRRQSERQMKKDMPEAVVSAPAVILTPLALYR